jgi:hypothetical protein
MTMLLQFIVENFTCFADEIVFSMVASADETQHEHHLIHSTSKQNPHLLRTSALYGANAHGKTKLVEAIAFAKNLVINGIKGTKLIPVAPFRLDKTWRNKPSRFEFIIFYQNVQYHYGFLINTQRVLEEWLFATPKTKEVRYFERITSETGKVQVEFGASLIAKNAKKKQFLEFVAQGTRPNQLFLTEAIERNVEMFKPLYEWFENVLCVVATVPHYLPLKASQEKSLIAFLSDFLKKADTGIQGIKTIPEKFDDNKLFLTMPEHKRLEIENHLRAGNTVMMIIDGAFHSLYSNELGEPILIRLETWHKGHDGSIASFDFSQESAGTAQIMHLLSMLTDLYSSESVYFVDELDRSLHALLSRLFLETYFKGVHDGHRSQLIFTTHDTQLLDLNLLRRDEIWFLEKNEQGASQLYSLANLKIRSDLDIQKGYINGRFGGIPFISD